MTPKKRIACLLVAAIGAGTLTMAGLSGQTQRGPKYKTPEDAIGKRVMLYIKPSSFGSATQPGALLTDSYNGASVSLGGELIHICDEWITISTFVSGVAGAYSNVPNTSIAGRPATKFVSIERDAVYAVSIMQAQLSE